MRPEAGANREAGSDWAERAPVRLRQGYGGQESKAHAEWGRNARAVGYGGNRGDEPPDGVRGWGSGVRGVGPLSPRLGRTGEPATLL